MRSHDDLLEENEAEAWYVEDYYSFGTFTGCVVACGKCGTQNKAPSGAKEVTCSGCSRFLVYRPWWEW